MTTDQIENLRSVLSEVLHRYAYPTEDAKVINECKAVLNTIRDYTARLQGYDDYDHELAEREKQIQKWRTMKVEFTPYPNK